MASFVEQLTGLCKTKKVEILKDKVNQVAENFHALVSHMPLANWNATVEAKRIAHSTFFPLFLQVIICDLPRIVYTCFC